MPTFEIPESVSSIIELDSPRNLELVCLVRINLPKTTASNAIIGTVESIIGQLP